MREKEPEGMRIAYFTESLYPHVDGVSRTLAQLFATLEARGVDFRIFSPFVPGPSVSWADRVRALRSFRFPLYPDYRVSVPGGAAVREELDAFRPELVHVVSPTPTAVWAQRWAREHGVPVVSSFHTHFVSYFRYYGAFLGRRGIRPVERAGWSFLRWFYSRCAAVYAPSTSIIRELAQEGIPGAELWSRGIDLSRFSPSFRDPAIRAAVGAGDEPILLMVSRLVKEKDLADLVGVHETLAARGVRYRLALVGDGPMRAELERALPGAHFAGHQTGEALARWYASADVFVFPSTTETFGNVVLEALASGLPAVVVDRGGPPDQIVPGVNGWVARANDVADIADQLEPLLRDRALRERMSRGAVRSAADRDWSSINGGLLRSYRRVIGGARRPGYTGSGARGPAADAPGHPDAAPAGAEGPVPGSGGPRTSSPSHTQGDRAS